MQDKEKIQAIQKYYPGFRVEVEFQLHATFADVCLLSNHTFIQYILDLVPDPQARSNMIHAFEDEAFRTAADSGDDQQKILALLLELTDDIEQKKQMLLRALSVDPIDSMTSYLLARATEIGVIYPPPSLSNHLIASQTSTAEFALNHQHSSDAEIELPNGVVKKVTAALSAMQILRSNERY